MKTTDSKEHDLLTYLSQYITLTQEEVDELIGLDIIKQFKKKTTLLREGEYSSRSYFVLKGCVISYYILDGENKVTAFYTENDNIVPQCYMTGDPSEYYLTCLEDSVLAVSDKDTTELYLRKYPKLETLCRVMAEKMLSDHQLSFDKYRNSTPEQRYLYLKEKRPDLLQRVPQYHLASYLGIKPESLSRIRRKLVIQGNN